MNLAFNFYYCLHYIFFARFHTVLKKETKSLSTKTTERDSISLKKKEAEPLSTETTERG